MLLLLHEMPGVTVSTKVGSNECFQSLVIIFSVLKRDGSFYDSNDSEDFIEDAKYNSGVSYKKKNSYGKTTQRR